MLPLLVVCQAQKTETHPDDQALPFPYDTASPDTSVTDEFYVSCDDGHTEESRETLGEKLCLAFSDKAQDLGLSDGGQHTGVYVFDYNGDGAQDIFITNADSENVLFSYTGSRFIAVATSLDQIEQINDVAAHDFDDDGYIDLAIASDQGNFVLTNSAGIYTTLQTPFESISSQTGKSVAWLGSDLLFGTDSGVSYYSYLGDIDFENITPELSIYDFDDVGDIAVGDIDDDDDLDFFAAKEVGEDIVYLNDGASFTDYAIDQNQRFPVNQSQFVEIAGQPSLALSLTRNGSDGLLICDETFTCTDLADELGISSPNNTTGAAYADLTGEGIQSIYKTNHQSQNELLIRTVDSNGDWYYFSDHAVLAGIDFNEKSTGTATLDYNSDGRLDIISVAEDGGIHLIENNTRFLE